MRCQACWRYSCVHSAAPHRPFRGTVRPRVSVALRRRASDGCGCVEIGDPRGTCNTVTVRLVCEHYAIFAPEACGVLRFPVHFTRRVKVVTLQPCQDKHRCVNAREQWPAQQSACDIATAPSNTLCRSAPAKATPPGPPAGALAPPAQIFALPCTRPTPQNSCGNRGPSARTHGRETHAASPVLYVSPRTHPHPGRGCDPPARPNAASAFSVGPKPAAEPAAGCAQAPAEMVPNLCACRKPVCPPRTAGRRPMPTDGCVSLQAAMFCATHSRGRFFGHKFTSNSRLSTRPRSLPRLPFTNRIKHL